MNQYETRIFHPSLPVFGTADPEATITVNWERASREGHWFYAEVPADDPENAQWQEAWVHAVINEAGPQGEDLVAEETRGGFVPATPEIFVHDEDGNLTEDGRWTYEWDAENRLIAMETRVEAATAGAPRKRLEFAYDSQWRRYSKEVFEWDDGTSSFIPQTSTLFLYDGWNLVAEYEVDGGTRNLLRSYLWGLDESGTWQGAGGVGGLLAVFEAGTSSSYLPAYDGNGNIHGYVDAASSEWVARFERGPFGEARGDIGPLAEAMRFRFSTKYEDAETGLLYYGYRYLNVETGRWLSRNPIEEAGGVNLYGFVGNNGVNFWDFLGLTGTNNCDDLIQWKEIAKKTIEGNINRMAGLCGNSDNMEFDSSVIERFLALNERVSFG